MSLCEDFTAYERLGANGRHPDVAGFLKSRGIVMADADGSPGPNSTRSMSRIIQKWYTVGPPEDRCLICCLDEHTSFLCPYNVEVPKNAIVGSGCDVICKVCDRVFFGRCCNQDTGRAKLKFCDICFKYGEHWMLQCPRKPECDLSEIRESSDHLIACAATGRPPIVNVRKKKKINAG
ncbi:hypothetical protein RchiOBHm_Chr5g0038761 [Rosa chinensis]|uniref:Uncharacterized protein n=2 Tax=Rosa chinensis TaxID=74649 RepID=A0A2P6QC24_ROSCH|nr:uncharacterized protein LOC112201575 isoform X1 [Rosa chinensis]PRQ31736.1 hypothetical protein RchiOBHm_Chr5g0038761 [Rosa chinensis]